MDGETILKDVQARIDARQRVRVDHNPGTLAALLFAEIGAHPERPIIWLTATEEAATHRYQALRAALADPGTHQRQQGRRVLHYPDWDVDAYSGLSPHAEITRRRIEVLGALLDERPHLYVMGAPALAKRVVPRSALDHARDWLAKGVACPRDDLVQRLVEGGYLRVDRVADRGTFAVRGHILDIYPPDAGLPVRIELWGDEIEGIRSFDPGTQRSQEEIEDLIVLPVHELVLTEAALDRASQALAELADARDIKTTVRTDLARQLRRGYAFAGRDDLLPLLHDTLDTVTDYVPANALVIVEEPTVIRTRLRNHVNRLAKHHADLLRSHPLVPPPESLYVAPTELLDTLMNCPGLDLEPADDADLTLPTDDSAVATLRERLAIERRRPDGMLTPLIDRLADWRDLDRVLLARTETSMRRLTELLEHREVSVVTHSYRVRPKDLFDPNSPVRLGSTHVHIAIGNPGQGFCWPQGKLVVITEEDIFGRRTRGSRTRLAGQRLMGPTDLSEGDLVVHATHGIGRFEGLTTLHAGGHATDVVHLSYRGGDKLYVPVHRLDLVRRYSGPGEDHQLDRMGAATFHKRTKKAAEAVQRLAMELLRTQAERERALCRPFSTPGDAYHAFAAAFVYEETRDQEQAIAAILKDMAAPNAMDRLLVGEVGFGKTEVAMRAAFGAVLDGRQVAVLVPTTVLAMQHTRTFAERMTPFGVEVAAMSRLRTPAEIRTTIAALEAGRVDIVIGTQRVIQGDVRFKDLGLLIIDEEHRFGVKDKERIKRLKANVDVLTMTATPIPRTLNLSVSGLRDLSVIETPPPGRQAVRTFVAPFSKDRIQRAIEFELKRGGQVFFVHNRVQSIHSMEQLLRRLHPDADIAIAHGQMKPRELESIMIAFIEGRVDILLSTTIIESGIDIPTANTLIVNRADRYGLAELHQLRGRVGRSSERGYCYLLSPAAGRMPEDAQRRLQVLQDNQHLGAGLRIAYEDMELRGTGQLLGKDQSGHVVAVGVETYLEMVQEAVGRLAGHATLQKVEIDVDLGAFIPSKWLPDPAERLSAYRQLVTADDPDRVLDFIESLEEVWGAPPEEVHRFRALAALRRLAMRAGVTLIGKKGMALFVSFQESPPIEPLALGGAEMAHRWSTQGQLLLTPDGDEDPLSTLTGALQVLLGDARNPSVPAVAPARR